jgi:hypothetical protein
MTFKLEVAMDDDVFGADAVERGIELSRILKDVSDGMRDGGASIGDNGTLDDLNGNTVGRYRIVEC